MSAFGRAAYRIFVFLLGIWTGAGIHDSLTSHFAWHADPVAYANRPTLPGMFSPWPFTTLLLLLATVAAAIVLRRLRGPGRREALAAVAGTALILVVTLAWFVPELGRMFGDPPMTGAELVAHSRTWIALNAVRIVALVGLFYCALLGLGRMAGPLAGPDPRD
ncbi:MAG TPA: hypothetical protein VF688_05130 [Allosphingosinicella sp.]